MVINADGPETRVALIEKGQLAELYIERRRERGIVGNIYKGRVKRVLPGMQAAFVDIGVEKAAFLYVADVRGAPEDFKSLFMDSDEDAKEDKKARERRAARIEDLVKEGQEIMIQVAKAPIGTKGARSTAYVSLPGRNLVFMPTVNHVGISRRIGTDKERKRLRAIIESMRPEGAGFIVRTVAEGVSEKELQADMEFLIKLWNSILAKQKSVKAPAVLYSDLDLLLRTVRDLFTPQVDKLIVDNKSEYERLLEVRRRVHAALRRQDRALRRARADLRRLRHRERDRSRARAQGVATLGRLAHHRSGRSAHRHRRQHRQVRRQEVGRARGDDHQDQPRGVQGGRRSAAPAQHRRHDHRRLHRHGSRPEPREGDARVRRGAQGGQGEGQRHQDLASSGSSR